MKLIVENLYFLLKNSKKEQLFHELEHDKTQLRIVENRSDKGEKSKSIRFPIKIEVGLINGKIADDYLNTISLNKNIDINHSNIAIYFIVDNGKDEHKSEFSTAILSPSFNDAFMLSIPDETCWVRFKIMLRNTADNTELEIDSFYIEGSTLKNTLSTHKHLMDSIVTENDNKYTFSIKYKLDALTKMKSLQAKIEKKEDLLANQVMANYESAKEQFESILTLKGIELLK